MHKLCKKQTRQTMQCQNLLICKHCKTECDRSIKTISPATDGPTIMPPYILITLTGGIIDQVTFYSDARFAIESLSRFVKNMNIDDQDAAIYTPDGFYANAKDFLDGQEQFMDNPEILDWF